jgi:DNA helicase-2/ATP-dependent DNA helicase PcrA
MSRPKIEINDNDVAYAEMILFGKEGAFDDDRNERKAFIKNLETIDLQAVPGSGKTTALLAKLLILEKYLPFEDGSGILVLSHTNNAVDIIKSKIGIRCPRLFTYPNFVGTIQSFVNQFLAIPYYSQKFGKRPYRIDDEIYKENIWIPRNAKTWLESNQYQGNKVLYESRLNENEELVIGFDNSATFPLKSKTSDTYKALLKMKQGLQEEGYLCFDDAYVQANRYLSTYPVVNNFFKKRFCFVFVDEMQDMDKHQYYLLENIFYDNGIASTVYQRIGDKNQAIYSNEVIIEDIWTNRGAPLQITGSRRLSSSIAKAVQPFGLTPQDICGNNDKNEDGTENNIPPHVIVYDDNSVKAVISKFCELVKKYQDESKIPRDTEYPINAIAWRKGDDDKLGLKGYWCDWQAEAVKTKIDHPYLNDFLLFSRKDGPQSKGLNDVRKSIIDALLKVLRLEQVKKPEGKAVYFSASGLMKHLKDSYPEFYDLFMFRLFIWCRDVFTGNIQETCKAIKEFIPDLLKKFDKTLDKAADFVNNTNPQEITASEKTSDIKKSRDNVYRCKETGIEVEVGTVHSVKGKTHTATLYMESYYEKDGRGENSKSYESQRLANQFKGENIGSKVGIRVKQSARMVYVGFSRPTHLLCFAVHKDRFDPMQDIFQKSGWEVNKLY